MSLEQDEPYEEESLNPDEDDGEDEDEDEEEANGDEVLSSSSQIGREQVGGSHVSGQEPGNETNEGWPMPEQSDTPPEWPEPTID